MHACGKSRPRDGLVSVTGLIDVTRAGSASWKRTRRRTWRAVPQGIRKSFPSSPPDRTRAVRRASGSLAGKMPRFITMHDDTPINLDWVSRIDPDCEFGKSGGRARESRPQVAFQKRLSGTGTGWTVSHFFRPTSHFLLQVIDKGEQAFVPRDATVARVRSCGQGVRGQLSARFLSQSIGLDLSYQERKSNGTIAVRSRVCLITLRSGAGTFL